MGGNTQERKRRRHAVSGRVWATGTVGGGGGRDAGLTECYSERLHQSETRQAPSALTTFTVFEFSPDLCGADFRNWPERSTCHVETRGNAGHPRQSTSQSLNRTANKNYISAARIWANNVTGLILTLTLPFNVESWPGLGCD